MVKQNAHTHGRNCVIVCTKYSHSYTSTFNHWTSTTYTEQRWARYVYFVHALIKSRNLLCDFDFVLFSCRVYWCEHVCAESAVAYKCASIRSGGRERESETNRANNEDEEENDDDNSNDDDDKKKAHTPNSRSCVRWTVWVRVFTDI